LHEPVKMGWWLLNLNERFRDNQITISFVFHRGMVVTILKVVATTVLPCGDVFLYFVQESSSPGRKTALHRRGGNALFVARNVLVVATLLLRIVELSVGSHPVDARHQRRLEEVQYWMVIEIACACSSFHPGNVIFKTIHEKPGSVMMFSKQKRYKNDTHTRSFRLCIVFVSFLFRFHIYSQAVFWFNDTQNWILLRQCRPRMVGRCMPVHATMRIYSRIRKFTDCDKS
jgi:hypothetical protein